MMQIKKGFDCDLFSVRPAAPGEGIKLNGIPVCLENVAKEDSRIDLMYKGKRVFIAEHILAPLKLLGIEDAIVVGKEKEWDFARPVHRFAYSVNMKTGSIFGPSDGRHCYEVLDAEGVYEDKESRRYYTVPVPVVYEKPGLGSIEILPSAPGTGMQFNLTSGKITVKARVFVTCKQNDKELIGKILKSRTPAVCGLDSDEPMWHAIGDFTADLCGIGKLTDGVVTAEVGFDYHALTIGSLRKLSEIEKEGH